MQTVPHRGSTFLNVDGASEVTKLSAVWDSSRCLACVWCLKTLQCSEHYRNFSFLFFFFWCAHVVLHHVKPKKKITSFPKLGVLSAAAEAMTFSRDREPRLKDARGSPHVIMEWFSLSWCVFEACEGNGVIFADVQQLQLGEGLKEGKPGEKQSLNNLWEVLLLSSLTVYWNEWIPW